MRVLVIGQKGDGPVRQRVVTPMEFSELWGPYAQWLWLNARTRTAVLGEYRIRLVLVP